MVITNCWFATNEVLGDMNDLTSDGFVSTWASRCSRRPQVGERVTFRDLFDLTRGPARVVSIDADDRVLLDVDWDRMID